MTIVEVLIKKAKQSTCRYRISCLGLNIKGEYLGSATNKPRFSRLHGGLHAEIALISRYGKQLKTIVLCRVGASGELRPIHACKNCQSVADKLGIKIVTLSEV